MLVRTVCGHDIRVAKGTIKVRTLLERDMFGPVFDVVVTAESQAGGRRYEIINEEIPLPESRRYRKRHDKILADTLQTVRDVQREYA